MSSLVGVVGLKYLEPLDGVWTLDGAKLLELEPLPLGSPANLHSYLQICPTQLVCVSALLFTTCLCELAIKIDLVTYLKIRQILRFTEYV